MGNFQCVLNGRLKICTYSGNCTFPLTFQLAIHTIAVAWSSVYSKLFIYIKGFKIFKNIPEVCINRPLNVISACTNDSIQVRLYVVQLMAEFTIAAMFSCVPRIKHTGFFQVYIQTMHTKWCSCVITNVW